MGRAPSRAQDLADAWTKASAADNGDPPGAWPGEGLSLAVGTVVRATRDLDNIEGVGPVPAGSLGYIFGEANCYNDGNGPMVQWFTMEDVDWDDLVKRGFGGSVVNISSGKALAARRVCNVYPGDVEVVRVHDTVDVRHVEEE